MFHPRSALVLEQFPSTHGSKADPEKSYFNQAPWREGVVVKVRG